MQRGMWMAVRITRQHRAAIMAEINSQFQFAPFVFTNFSIPFWTSRSLCISIVGYPSQASECWTNANTSAHTFNSACRQINCLRIKFYWFDAMSCRCQSIHSASQSSMYRNVAIHSDRNHFRRNKIHSPSLMPSNGLHSGIKWSEWKQNIT